MPVIPGFGRMESGEFKAGLVYIVSFRQANDSEAKVGKIAC